MYFITIFPSTLRFFQVASPLEAYPNKILYAFVTLQFLRYKNSNGCEWCRTEYCQVKTPWADPEFGLHQADDISASLL